jgi:hypothetical protein
MIRVAHVITNLTTGGAEMMLYRILQAMDRSRFKAEVFSLKQEVLSLGPVRQGGARRHARGRAARAGPGRDCGIRESSGIRAGPLPSRSRLPFAYNASAHNTSLQNTKKSRTRDLSTLRAAGMDTANDRESLPKFSRPPDPTMLALQMQRSPGSANSPGSY